MHILMIDWRGSGSVGRYEVFRAFNLPLFYSIFELSLVSFSFLLCLQYFVKSQKMMFIIILTLLILEILFGGVLNNYFTWHDETSGDNWNMFLSPYSTKGLYPKFLYWPTAIAFPLFGPSQHIQSTRTWIETITVDGYTFEWFNWVDKDSLSYTWTIITDELGNSNTIWSSYEMTETAARWNALWILPYLHTAIFTSIAITLSKTRRND